MSRFELIKVNYFTKTAKGGLLMLLYFQFSFCLLTRISAQSVGMGASKFVPANMLDVNGSMVVGTFAGVTTAPANSLLVSGNVGFGTSTVTEPVGVGSSSTNHIGLFNGTGTLLSSIYQNGTQLTFNMPGTSTDAGVNFVAFRHSADANKIFFGDDGTNTYIGSTKPTFVIYASFAGPARMTGARAIIVFKSATMFVGIGQRNPLSKVDVVTGFGLVGYQQLRLRTSYTPTGSADANGNVGDTAWDDNYFYIKTSVGWKRAALAAY